MCFRRAVALAASFITLSWAAPAIADDWVVARVTGAGWIVSQTAAPVELASGMAVPLGATVATSPNGRAMLVKGRDTMMLGPGTVVAVPYKADRGLKTTVYQQIGKVDLNIEKRRSPHFSVQTPYLAAVVKGTEFTVNVSATDAEVSVSSGLVTVADLETGDRSDIGAGQMASASPAKGSGLAVAGANGRPEVRAGRPQEPALASPGQTLSSAQPGSNGNSAAAGASSRGNDDSASDRGQGRSDNANTGNAGGNNKGKGANSGNNGNGGNNGKVKSASASGSGNASGSGAGGSAGGGSSAGGGGASAGGSGSGSGGVGGGGGSDDGSDDDDDDEDDDD